MQGWVYGYYMNHVLRLAPNSACLAYSYKVQSIPFRLWGHRDLLSVAARTKDHSHMTAAVTVYKRVG